MGQWERRTSRNFDADPPKGRGSTSVGSDMEVLFIFPFNTDISAGEHLGWLPSFLGTEDKEEAGAGGIDMGRM